MIHGIEREGYNRRLHPTLGIIEKESGLQWDGLSAADLDVKWSVLVNKHKREWANFACTDH